MAQTYCSLFVLIILLSCTGPQTQEAQSVDEQAASESPTSDDQWVSLFNGEDMSGWVPKIRGYALGENYGNTFRVEDGLLKVRYDAYSNFNQQYGHLFYKKPFSN